MIAAPTRTWLLALARRSLRDALAHGDPTLVGLPAPLPPRPEDPVLDRPMPAFVSWHASGKLVGCLGLLEAREPLEAAVRRLSVEAGLHDPRTPPLDPARWDELCAEIEVLSAFRPLGVRGLDRIEALLRPGRDGVVLERGFRRAVYLPVVWEQIPDPHDFLRHLALKAHLDPVADAPEMTATVFEAERFGE